MKLTLLGTAAVLALSAVLNGGETTAKPPQIIILNALGVLGGPVG